MAHITKLPKGLKYYEHNGQRVLDIRATHIEVIPARLRGVDVVWANEHQVEYISPDYNGALRNTVVDLTGFSLSHSRTFLPENEEMKSLKNKYRDMVSLSPAIFDIPYSTARTGITLHDEETRLPSNLRFSWNRKQGKGHLDATLTWLTERPEIEGIEGQSVDMPTAEAFAERIEVARLARKQLKKKRYGIPPIRHTLSVWRKEM